MRGISEALFSTNTYTILGIEYKQYKIKGNTYVFKQPFHSQSLLYTPNGKNQVTEITDMFLLTKEGNFPIFKFSYYNEQGKQDDTFVYTETGEDFFELGDKEFFNKPKETPIQEEVGKRKGLVKRVVERVMHPKRKK